jgi:hypothetical protein
MGIETRQHNPMVIIAGIAADLSSVMRIAWEVTLASKNAMFIASRAGEKARGFQPITGFIDEIASSTTSGVTKISKQALAVSRMAVEELRARDAAQRFRLAVELAGDAPYLASLSTSNRQLEQTLVELQRRFAASNEDLSDELESLDDGMRAASAIAAVCRIEASRAAEYRTNLTVVADNLDTATGQIKDKITISRKRLKDMMKIENLQTGRLG